MSPLVSSDESSVEVIEVLDPCHPLYGRTFRVIRRVDRGSGNFSPSYEVEYLQITVYWFQSRLRSLIIRKRIRRS